MYIYRELLSKIVNLYTQSEQPKGLILGGIVGCGKTTLIEKLLEVLANDFEILSYSGDDTRFRQNLIHDSNFLYNEASSRSNRKKFIFVDEVQKSAEVFDALKIAFDKAKVSFIVSGSNPSFLSTIARRRLQRRAEQWLMLPISLAELAVQHQWASASTCDLFSHILWKLKSISDLKIPHIPNPGSLKDLLAKYFTYGGLPLAWTAPNEEESLREIRLVVERGFDLMSQDNNSLAELTRVELAHLHSREFTYKNIMEKTRTRRRDAINKTLDDLMNHAYLTSKKPVLFTPGKTSYLTVFSYIDPGIVSYLTGHPIIDGYKIEGYVHSRLHYLIYNSVYKSDLGYYKPYTLDINKNIRYLQGEIDFLFQSGQRVIPIEVKSTANIHDVDSELVISFLREKKLPFGLIIYGGLPYISQKDRIIYWPYWLI